MQNQLVIAVYFSFLMLFSCQKIDNSEEKSLGAGQVEVANDSCRLRPIPYRIGGAQTNYKIALFETMEIDDQGGHAIPSLYLTYQVNETFPPQYRKINFPKRLAFQIGDHQMSQVYCAKYQASKQEILQARRKAETDAIYQALGEFYDQFHFVYCAKYEQGDLVDIEVYSPTQIETFKLDYQVGNIKGCGTSDYIKKAYQNHLTVDAASPQIQNSIIHALFTGIKSVADFVYDGTVAVYIMKVQEWREAKDKAGQPLKPEAEIVAEIEKRFPDALSRNLVLYPFDKKRQLAELLPHFLTYNLNAIYSNNQRAEKAFGFAFATMYAGELDRFSHPQATLLAAGNDQPEDGFVLLRQYIQQSWPALVSPDASTSGDEQPQICDSANPQDKKIVPYPEGASQPVQAVDIFQTLNNYLGHDVYMAASVTSEADRKQKVERCQLYVQNLRIADQEEKEKLKLTKPFWMGSTDILKVGRPDFHNYSYQPGKRYDH